MQRFGGSLQSTGILQAGTVVGPVFSIYAFRARTRSTPGLQQKARDNRFFFLLSSLQCDGTRQNQAYEAPGLAVG